MGNADVGNRGQPNLAVTLVALETGNKGVEHARAHGGHSRRERDVIRNPTRRRYAPALLDTHDRVDGQTRVGEQPPLRQLMLLVVSSPCALATASILLSFQFSTNGIG